MFSEKRKKQEIKPAVKQSKLSRIAKHNDLINASYNLDTTEQRLILLAITEVRKKDKDAVIDANTVIDIPASSYSGLFNTTKQAAYIALRDAGLSLKRREFTFVSKRNGIVHGGWLQYVEYIEHSATLSLSFTSCVIPYISQLEENFTTYEIHQISQLKSKYAIRLYELLIQWQNNKDCQVPEFELEEFRAKMGLASDDYPRIDNLKNRVIVPAVKQINEFSNITITDIEQTKKGKCVTGFKFSYKRDEPLIDVSEMSQQDGFIKLTANQLHLFSSKMARMPEMERYAVGNESYESLAVKITEMLLDKEKQLEIKEYLIKAGYGGSTKAKY